MNIAIAALASLGALSSGALPDRTESAPRVVVQASGVGAEAAQIRQRWVFDSNPAIELWFHGMALVDPQGPGPNSLYDLSYPERVREAKREMGAYPTALDQSVGRLAAAFRRDPALEVLHFLPLYFAEAGRAEMFDALKALAVQSAGVPRAQTPRVAMGLSALAAVLPTVEQRHLLGEFVAALEAEWDAFYGEYYRSEVTGRRQYREPIQALWDQLFHPAIAPFLAQGPLAAGTVALCSSLGMEGRVFSGIPQDLRDNVMAVRELRGPEGPREVAFMVLRELSFSEARKALEGMGLQGAGRQEGEALVSTGAVWVGALLLERVLPEESIRYKEFFLAQGGWTPSAEGVDGAFEDAYPLDPAVISALREEIVTRTSTGG